MARPVRIANCSGFYGDRLSAAQEQLDGGPIDYLTGDYLAELTMSILSKQRQKHSDAGFAATFLKQMEQVLGTAIDKGVKVVTNAGGINPAALAEKLREVNDRLGLNATIMHIEGDDLRDRITELQAEGHDFVHLDTGEPLAARTQEIATANVYLGSWAIVEALRQGADMVVCPRVTDAAVTVGPAAYHHDWRRDDWDRLAGAVVAGHVLECGCQATGGNYAFFSEVPDLSSPGFPIAEIEEDGQFVVTKHPGTGGLVSVGTVTAQLLYEIDSPRYLTPDVVTRFDSIELRQDGPDRVRVSGVKGEPAPSTAKLSINLHGGYRNSISFPLVGLDIEHKARVVEEALWARVGGRARFDAVHVELIRSDRPDPSCPAEAVAQLRVTVMDRDPAVVGRAFSSAAVELGLANYPGFFLPGAPGGESAYAVNWPTLLPAALVEQVVVGPNGSRTSVPLAYDATAFEAQVESPTPVELPTGPVRRAPLGSVFGARSGDKGGNANVGVWARSPQGYTWLAEQLTVDRFRELVPDAKALVIERYELPRIRALNFVVMGLLGQGAAANPAPDPQAKSLGEFLRARYVELPDELLAQDAVT